MYAELARVIVGLGFRERLRSFALPYPRDAQLMLDRMSLVCIEGGHKPPTGVPELLAWCRSLTIVPQLLGLPQAYTAHGEPLIDPQRLLPSRTCLEWSSLGSGDGAEQRAASWMADVMSRAGTPEAYRRCLTFLAEHPVIVQRDRTARRQRWDGMVWSRVKHLYRRVPEYLVNEGRMTLCGTCGLPALPGPGQRDAHWCERGDCPPGVAPRVIHRPQEALVLEPSLRVFVALPRAVERDAVARLARAGVRCVPLPSGLGEYRLPDNASGPGSLLVVDRCHPGLLAHRAVAVLDRLEKERLIVVLPAQAWNTPGYRSALDDAVAVRKGRLIVTHAADLVRRVGVSRTSPEGVMTPDA